MKRRYFLVDDKKYEIVRVASRDEVDPLIGVRQLGNAVVIKASNGKLWYFLEWDGEIVEVEE